MGEALSVAAEALVSDDVPVGALVLAPDGGVLGVGRNRREAQGDPTAHAEVVAIRAAAAALGSWRLEGCTLVVTLEPCAMCAGALVLARVARLVVGAPDLKAGFTGSLGNIVQDPRLNHRAELVTGVQADASGALLRTFFRDRR